MIGMTEMKFIPNKNESEFVRNNGRIRSEYGFKFQMGMRILAGKIVFFLFSSFYAGK
jgi:hypothetical protein